jgi:hypothetical protein
MARTPSCDQTIRFDRNLISNNQYQLIALAEKWATRLGARLALG